ncbi:MAG: HU family DNA-binding protein [Patescibacteria group bacterium]
MNKAELIENLSTSASLSKKQVEDLLDGFVSLVQTTLKAGNEVTIAGFGTFLARHRSARMGVNPQNPSQKIQIPEVIVPKFKAGKGLKDALKGNNVASN